MASKKYYPNNWQAVRDIPDDIFEPTDYEIVIDYLVDHWDINSSVDTILRATNIKTKAVKEYTYIRPSNAKKRLEKLCKTKNYEIIVMRANEMYTIFPNMERKDEFTGTH